MADKKVVFVAFAIEDERQRDFLKGQSLHPRAPFEFIDMSVKQPYDKDWKDRVRTRIRRSDGIIILVSKNSHGLISVSRQSISTTKSSMYKNKNDSDATVDKFLTLFISHASTRQIWEEKELNGNKRNGASSSQDGSASRSGLCHLIMRTTIVLHCRRCWKEGKQWSWDLHKDAIR